MEERFELKQRLTLWLDTCLIHLWTVEDFMGCQGVKKNPKKPWQSQSSFERSSFIPHAFERVIKELLNVVASAKVASVLHKSTAGIKIQYLVMERMSN